METVLSKNRISIHLITKDRMTELSQLLVSLCFQTYKEFDIVIVDSSQPVPIWSYKPIAETIFRLLMLGHGVQTIHTIPDGVCNARNKAIDEDIWKDKNKYVCRIDDDSVVEMDYLERLINLIEGCVYHDKDCEGDMCKCEKRYEDVKDIIKKNNIGAVGCIVPLWSQPAIIRDVKFFNKIASEIKCDEEGNLLYIGDDLGYLWNEKVIRPASHLRSSFLIQRKLFDSPYNIRYCTNLTKTGFREESILSLDILSYGFDLLVDTGAIAWHNRCMSGGTRSNDYNANVVLDDWFFKKYFKEIFIKGKIKKEVLNYGRD